MQFPNRDSMTSEESVRNSAAASNLIPGTTYRFTPAITASAIPVGGPGVCPPQECVFETGWYLGFVDGNHVFQGKPINDDRPILDDYLRESYFPVLFTGGSIATPVNS